MPGWRLAAPVADSSSSSKQEVGPLRRVLTPSAVAITVAAVVGVVLRVRLLGSDRGDLLADEAFTGLLSAEIFDGYFPVMINGIGYTAPLESYVYAPIAATVGMSVLWLKLVPVLLWAVTGVVIAVGTRHVLGRGGALVAGLVAWLPAGALLAISFRAYQGYASGLVVCAAVMVVALRTVMERHAAPRWQSAFTVGVLVGLVVWIHPVYLVSALPMLVVVSVPRWRSVRYWWAPLAGGGLVGSSLLLAWNAKNGWPSLSQPAEATESVPARFVRLITELVPRFFGVRTYGNQWVVPAVLAVVIIAVAFAVIAVGVRRLWAYDRWVAAVVGAPLLGGLPLMSLLTNASFTDDGRYAIVFVAPVAVAVAAAVIVPGSDAVPIRGWSVLAVWVAAVVVPWSLGGVHYGVDDPDSQVAQLVDVVGDAGFDRLAGYYWAVLPAEFLSDQNILVATAGHPPVVLLADTQREVEATPATDLAMVFAGEAPEALLRLPLHAYDIVAVGNWLVYLPADDVRAGADQ